MRLPGVVNRSRGSGTPWKRFLRAPLMTKFPTAAPEPKCLEKKCLENPRPLRLVRGGGAKILGVSSKTVNRDWSVVQIWFYGNDPAKLGQN